MFWLSEGSLEILFYSFVIFSSVYAFSCFLLALAPFFSGVRTKRKTTVGAARLDGITFCLPPSLRIALERIPGKFIFYILFLSSVIVWK